jgi:hypothetical protein
MRRRGRKTHARPCTQPLLETEFELLLREFAPAPSGALKIEENENGSVATRFAEPCGSGLHRQSRQTVPEVAIS